MLTYTLSAVRGSPPLYRQLCDALRADIAARRFAPDEKLPSKRTLAAQLGVSVLTVEAAYAQLLSEGWIYTRPKSGHFATPLAALPRELSALEASAATCASRRTGQSSVHSATATSPFPAPEKRQRSARDPRESAARNHGQTNDEIIDLAGGGPDVEDFPFSVWAKIVRRLLSGGNRELLAPTPSAGAMELREAVAEHLREFRGMQVDPERVFVAAGAETLYALLVRALGTARPWAVENPGHRTIAAVYRQCGAVVRPVPVDSGGLSADALAASGAAVAHVSPAHQYPTGVVAPAARRYEWLAWAAEEDGRVLVEDDYDSELRAEGLPLPTLQSMDAAGRVVHLGTFSRTLAPSLRVGCMVVPEPLLPRFREVFAPLSCTVPNLMQFALAAFLSEGHFARHLARTRTRCRRVRSELLEALRSGPLAGRSEIAEERAGPHLLLSLRTRRPDSTIAAAASAAGIRVRLLSSFYDGPAPRAAAGRLVLDYSALRPGRAVEAVERLARLLS